MKRCLLTPVIENMTEADSISSRGVLRDRRAGAGRDVGIAGRVDDPPGEDRLAAGLALGDDAADRPVLDDRRDERAGGASA